VLNIKQPLSISLVFVSSEKSDATSLFIKEFEQGTLHDTTTLALIPFPENTQFSLLKRHKSLRFLNQMHRAIFL